MTPGADFGRCFALLRKYTQQIWLDYTHHSFVEQIREGSLPPETFKRYLEQEYTFMFHIARAWALAIAKTETLEEMRYTTATTYKIVQHDIHQHKQMCYAAGIAESALGSVIESNVNRAYVRYTIDTGYGGDLLDSLVTLAPCSMGYAEIGRRFAAAGFSEKYDFWIQTCIDETLQNSCRQFGHILDVAVLTRLGENFEATSRWKRLCEQFQAATRFESQFWDASFN